MTFGYVNLCSELSYYGNTDMPYNPLTHFVV